jgi:hypothetical protein
VDSVLFMNYEVSTDKDDKKRAFGDGSAVLLTQRMPSFDAKNRFGLPAVIALPRCEDVSLAPAAMWGAYQKALLAAQARPATDTDSLTQELGALAAQVADPAMRDKVNAAIGKALGNPAELVKIKNRLLALVSKGKEKGAASAPITEGGK